MFRRVTTILAGLLIAFSSRAYAQSARPQFEVASVKPYVESSSGPMDFSGFQAQPGGRFRVAGVNLKALITYAYRLRDDQIIGGPDWISSDLWEITAKAAEGAVPVTPKSYDPAVPDTMAQMVQTLIGERFHLKLGPENRLLPIYELVVSKGGPGIRLSDDQTPPIPSNTSTGRQGTGPPPPPRGTLNMSGTPSSSSMQGRAVPVSYLASGLAIQLRRAVIDKTNLKGLYDFRLQWMTDPILLGIASPAAEDPSSAGGSIFTAVDEQLGLKLESARGIVPVLVIDSVSRPSEN